MAIRVEYRPNQTLMSMLQFFAGASERKAADERAQAQRRSQQSAQMGDSITSGIQGAIKMNAQRLDRENRLAVESARTRGRLESDFFDKYGVTPGSLAAQVPQTGAGMLQRPVPAGEEVAMAGGQAGPPASMMSGMQDIPLTPEAQQQGVAPLSQTQPPEEAGAQYYAQGNMAVVPTMVKLKKRLDKYTAAADMVVSKSRREMPDEEKAAQLSMLSPYIASMKREYDALTKRYPAPKPITDYAGLQNAGFAIDMPGNDAVWYKTKDGYKPMTVHPKDSQGWMSEQDPEVREAKKVQHFQDNYFQNEDGTEFLFDGKKWSKQKADKEADYGKEFDRKVALELDYILEQHAGDKEKYSLTREDRIRARAMASEYIDFKNQALGRGSQSGGQERRVYTPAENEVFAIERMSKARGGRILAAERQRLIELQQIIQMEQSEFPQMPSGAGLN